MLTPTSLLHHHHQIMLSNSTRFRSVVTPTKFSSYSCKRIDWPDYSDKYTQKEYKIRYLKYVFPQRGLNLIFSLHWMLNSSISPVFDSLFSAVSSVYGLALLYNVQASFTFTEQVILRRHQLKYDDNNRILSSSTWLNGSKRKKEITLP